MPISNNNSTANTSSINNSMALTPFRGAIDATLYLPGSKSIANRVLLLASIANGVSVIHNVPDTSEDVALMLEALITLGVKIERQPTIYNHSASNINHAKVTDVSNGVSYKIHGNSGNFVVRQAKLFLGNSGTTMRFLLAVLALATANTHFTQAKCQAKQQAKQTTQDNANSVCYHLYGIERMHERPIQDLVQALTALGGQINYLAKDGYPPLRIYETMNNQQESVYLSGKTSSQYLSALLLAIALLRRSVNIIIEDELISRPYVTITTKLLQLFAINITTTSGDTTNTTNKCTNNAKVTHNKEYNDDYNHDHNDGFSYKFSYVVDAGSNYTDADCVNVDNTGVNTKTSDNRQTNYPQAVEYTIEPDASSASYFMAIGALAGKITIHNLSQNSLQGDKDFAHILKQMGAHVHYAHNSITVSKQEAIRLKALTVNMQDMPDVAMTLAVMALFAEGITHISGIASWRVKETDRIWAMSNELRKLGAIVNFDASSITISPPKAIIPNVAIDTYNDHRMAMCFSLVAAYGVPVVINDYCCVRKTFPHYFTVLQLLVRK